MREVNVFSNVSSLEFIEVDGPERSRRQGNANSRCIWAKFHEIASKTNQVRNMLQE